MTKAEVLLVNELPDETELYSIGLELAGYRVRTARDVGEMNAVLKEAAADVVVVSPRLTDPASWQAIERLTAEYPNAPVVLLTEYVRFDGANRRRAVASGCAAFVPKPCSAETLAEVLRRVLDGARGANALPPDS